LDFEAEFNYQVNVVQRPADDGCRWFSEAEIVSFFDEVALFGVGQFLDPEIRAVQLCYETLQRRDKADVNRTFECSAEMWQMWQM